MKLGNNRVTP